MTNADLVSIIIPAYNAQAFLDAAIKSVLSQDHQPLEVIVVDDGSTDNTAAIAASFAPSVSCIRQSNGGPPAARNRGLAAAGGSFIGFLDADDIYEPNCISLQLAKLRDNPGIDVAIGRMTRETLVSRQREPLAFEALPQDDHVSNQLGVCLFRRTVFEKVGVMEESLLACDDWDWFMRARELEVPMLLHDEFVLRQRLHQNNLTRNREAIAHYISIMLKRSIDRRRAMSGKAQSLTSFATFHETAKPGNNGS